MVADGARPDRAMRSETRDRRALASFATFPGSSREATRSTAGQRREHRADEDRGDRDGGEREIQCEAGMGLGIARGTDGRDRREQPSDDGGEKRGEERDGSQGRDLGCEPLRPGRADRAQLRVIIGARRERAPQRLRSEQDANERRQGREDPKTVHERVVGPVHLDQAVAGGRDGHGDIGGRG